MVCLFEKDANSYTGNGICVLNPTACIVSEIAGGSYLLHMEHPIDDEGKWMMLTEERIIKAPVPPMHVQSFTLPDVMVWQVKQTVESANLYTVLPSYKRIPCPDAIKKVKQNPSAYAYNDNVVYKRGEYCSFRGGIYHVVSDYSYRVLPTSQAATWAYDTTVAGSGDRTEESGGTYTTIAAGTQVAKIADYNGTYMQVRVLQGGNVGYIERELCEETQTEESGQTIAAFDISEQPFRICRIDGDDDGQSIVVEAMHISYDFKGNALYACDIKGADPMTAISILRGALLDADNRTIVSNISGKTVSKDWSFMNPINALLDPDTGMVPQLGAQLIRNNRDFYILSNDSPRPGIRMAYGHNLIGVSWSRDTTNVITRVLPRCGDGHDGNLYLEDIYVESEISTQYAFQRTEMMNCGFAVGDKYEKPDGSEITLTEETAREQMLEDAQKRFTVDKVDAVEVELEVNFVLIGDTEEYRQYRGLQTVCMYDEITVDMNKSGMTATAQIVEYEYDCILRRYNKIRVGNILNMQRRIPGYRLSKGSITYDKLGHNIISRIKSSVAAELSAGENTEVNNG